MLKRHFRAVQGRMPMTGYRMEIWEQLVSMPGDGMRIPKHRVRIPEPRQQNPKSRIRHSKSG